jgi:hypothetical protein
LKQAIVAVVDGPPVRALCWLLLAALVVRGLVLGATWRQLRADPDHYARLARNLAEHGMFSFHPPRPTAYRPPLYPLLLAPLSGPQGVRPAAVAALHLLLGLFTVAAVTICGRRMQLGRTALLAGALVALDPILMYQSSLVMTEALAAALAAAALWALASLPQQGTDSAKRTAPARRPAIDGRNVVGARKSFTAHLSGLDPGRRRRMLVGARSRKQKPPTAPAADGPVAAGVGDPRHAVGDA